MLWYLYKYSKSSTFNCAANSHTPYSPAHRVLMLLYKYKYLYSNETTLFCVRIAIRTSQGDRYFPRRVLTRNKKALPRSQHDPCDEVQTWSALASTVLLWNTNHFCAIFYSMDTYQDAMLFALNSKTIVTNTNISVFQIFRANSKFLKIAEVVQINTLIWANLQLQCVTFLIILVHVYHCSNIEISYELVIELVEATSRKALCSLSRGIKNSITFFRNSQN